MSITNRQLDEKLDIIHTRINNVITSLNDNMVSIVKIDGKVGKLVEHVKIQNGRIGKIENDEDSRDGICKDHEDILRDITNRIDKFFSKHDEEEKMKEKKSEIDEERRFEWKKFVFDHIGSFITGITIGIVLILAQVIWGI